MEKYRDIGNRIKGFDSESIVEKFNDWNKLKKEIHFQLKRVEVSKGDIWWGSLGQNIGVEIYGKNENFSRPILIIRVVEGGKNVIGIPLTSKKHEGSWYSCFKSSDGCEYAVLPQIRSVDVARLYQKIGQLSETVTNKITNDFIRYLLDKK